VKRPVSAVVTAVVVVTAAVALAAPASGQTDPTVTVPEPTTTVVEVPTTTVTVPEAPTTTLVPTTPVTVPQIDLPGEHVTVGDLHLGASFEDADASSCTVSGSVAGGEMNVMRDEVGSIGAVYGKANLGAAEAGLVMVALGPLPVAIGAFRTTGSCNQDVVAVGSYEATPTSATLTSVGYGLFPKDFATSVEVSLQVGATEPTASLDLQGAYDFLAVKRPGS
jgi:hypothetical protein